MTRSTQVASLNLTVDRTNGWLADVAGLLGTDVRGLFAHTPAADLPSVWVSP